MNKGNYNYPPSSPSHRPQSSSSPRKTIHPYHGLQRRISTSSICSHDTNVSSKSITSILTKNKKNVFLEFLIILCDDDYKSAFYYKSTYENLLKQRKFFNDNLNIVNKKDITKNNEYLIDGMATLKKLYIKLPKENLYVNSSQFHNRYLNSKINELISIFTVLKAKHIKVTIDCQTENNFKFNLSAGVKLNGVSLKSGAEKTHDKSNKLQSNWELEFFQNNNGNTNGNNNGNTNNVNTNHTKININEFADDNRFYYLPKEAEWIDAIRKRISQNVSSDKFTYSYSDTNDIKYKAFTNLQLFDISCDYNKKQFENITINYEIEYYPLDTVIIENKFSNNNNVIIINNNKNDKDDKNMNILDYVNNFLSSIF